MNKNKGQYLAEVRLGMNESLTNCVIEALNACKVKNNVEAAEVHQIVCVRPDEFLILINFYL